MNSNVNDNENRICEWLPELFLPNLANTIKANGFESVFDFLLELNKNKSMQVLKHFSNTEKNATLDHLASSLDEHNDYLVSSMSDLFIYLKACSQFEANFVYVVWLFNLFKPLITTLFITLFLLPSVIVIPLYGSLLFLFLTKHWNKLVTDINSHEFLQASYKSIAIFCETLGAFWHGHEIVDIDNIPDSGPALVIFYHAVTPIDFYYFHSKTLLYKNRKIKIIAERFWFKVPGLSYLLEAFEVSPDSYETCVSLLNKGELLAFSPGGVREAFFSDHNYEIIWGKQTGFAHVAATAKVPIVPMFTQNCREALRTVPFFRGFFRYIYEKTGLPFVAIYGLFPVKLRTYIGKPIAYDESRSVEELKELTKQRIEDMIKEHQRLPGSIFQALLDRFRS